MSLYVPSLPQIVAMLCQAKALGVPDELDFCVKALIEGSCWFESLFAKDRKNNALVFAINGHQSTFGLKKI